jgi:subtilisin family serine protease
MLDGSGAGSGGPAVDASVSLLVRFAAGDTAAEVQARVAAVGGRIVEGFPGGPSVVSLPTQAARDAAVDSLGAEPDVVYAQPDSTIHIADTIPNDPQFNQQWGLSDAQGTSIDAPAAWDVTTGSSAIVVAFLDSGIDQTDPEFAGRLWTNPVDGTHGWNFIANNANVQDDNNHGTHVAGIFGANSNNAFGVAGVDWHAQIMPVKIIDANGNGSVDQAVSAVYWAVDHGARIINASWDGQSY